MSLKIVKYNDTNYGTFICWGFRLSPVSPTEVITYWPGFRLPDESDEYYDSHIGGPLGGPIQVRGYTMVESSELEFLIIEGESPINVLRVELAKTRSQRAIVSKFRKYIAERYK